MREQRPWGLPHVACGKCGLTILVAAGVVRMGASDLFVCPRCNYQEVWRDGKAPTTTPSRSVVL